MPSRTEDTPWDFSPVLELLGSLSSTEPVSAKIGDVTSHRGTSDPPDRPKTTESTPSKSLGDFSRIWEYLGASPGQGDSQSAQRGARPLLENEYTSDGATYYPPLSSKGVKWRDEAVVGGELEEAVDLADNAAARLPTKSQRRKEKRKLAKVGQDSKGKSTSEPESDVDPGRARKSPAGKASVHSLSPKKGADGAFPQRLYNLRPRSNSTSTTPVSQKKGNGNQKKLVAVTEPKKTHVYSLRPATMSPSPASRVATQTPKLDALNSLPSQSPPKSKTSDLFASTEQGAKKIIENRVCVADAYKAIGTSRPTRPVKPLVERKGDDRHFALLLKLIHNFGEDRSWLVKPVQSANHTTSPQGIHIFVDFSNIFIGFNEHVKRAKGLFVHHRAPMTNISFESLVLLMERRRPVAKRVLAGSAPLVPAFGTAKEIGYELNILDKVLKAKELTERQKYFQQRDGSNGTSNRRNSRGAEPNASSGSETTAAATGSGSGQDGTSAATQPALAREKWVEQAVDEILHLKILESVVDVEKPTTMVLATGDGAEAEYSEGFMRMVERALKKGWKVEVVSWSKNISGAYRKASFRQRWGTMFRIIELDDYAEDLLDI